MDDQNFAEERYLQANTAAHRYILPRSGNYPSNDRASAAEIRQPGLPRPTRALVQVACRDCQLRKCKCDGQRPRCGGCQGRGKECHWDVEAGMTRMAALKKGKQKLLQDVQDYDELYDYLGNQEESHALHLFSVIRGGATMPEALNYIRGETGRATVSLPRDQDMSEPAEDDDQEQERYAGMAFGMASFDPYGSLLDTGSGDSFANFQPIPPSSSESTGWLPAVHTDGRLDRQAIMPRSYGSNEPMSVSVGASAITGFPYDESMTQTLAFPKRRRRAG